MTTDYKDKSRDKELEEFRNLMTVPDTFENGFKWSSLLGAIFIALLMVPGALYMGLLAGPVSIGPAAQWVTVILFIEIARRAQRSLKKQEVFVLFWMAAAAMSLPFSGLLWNQFFINSDAAIKQGMAEIIPDWYAPPVTSDSYNTRSFFHPHWYKAIALVIFGTFVGQIQSVFAGYGLFRLTSDIEKLPFPMAPVGAQGIMALAEDAEKKNADDSEASWRWRAFSIGGAIGLAWGMVYLLLPAVSGAITGRAIQIFPIPFTDLTPITGKYLKAVATGINWNMGQIISGMVMPFWAMVGSLIGLIITMVLNPCLYHFKLLSNWKVGDGTIETLYKNNIDFYFSFTIGVSLAIFLAGMWKVIQTVRAKRESARRMTEYKRENIGVPEGRGDIPAWAIISVYVFLTSTNIVVCGFLIEWHRGVMLILIFLGFIYTPIISYVTARLEGIAGQVVEIPMIKEACLILSGYPGVAVWFLPMPLANHGTMTMFYRKCELTGTRFTSIWKAKIFLFPIILASSILFANFIWGLAQVPSGVYPYAQKMWPLNAEMRCIMYSSTMGEYSMFEEAWNVKYLLWGAGAGTAIFAILSSLGAPVFLVYGVVRGLGQTMPHAVVTQFFGALLGHFYFRKRFGKMWRKYIPVIAAGFACGVGLITIFGIGIVFLKKSIVQLPF
jgi:hypothetical protein